jgi:hypothetical protein
VISRAPTTARSPARYLTKFGTSGGVLVEDLFVGLDLNIGGLATAW